MLTTRKVNMVVGALKPRKISREYNIKIHSRKNKTKTNQPLLYLPHFQKPRVFISLEDWTRHFQPQIGEPHYAQSLLTGKTAEQAVSPVSLKAKKGGCNK